MVEESWAKRRRFTPKRYWMLNPAGDGVKPLAQARWSSVWRRMTDWPAPPSPIISETGFMVCGMLVPGPPVQTRAQEANLLPLFICEGALARSTGNFPWAFAATLHCAVQCKHGQFLPLLATGSLSNPLPLSTCTLRYRPVPDRTEAPATCVSIRSLAALSPLPPSFQQNPLPFQNLSRPPPPSPRIQPSPIQTQPSIHQPSINIT